jgi:UDP-N-acetylmuramoyl-L-alanyl-D-glutamate--2,6-diaminopimelate ligase
LKMGKGLYSLIREVDLLNSLPEAEIQITGIKIDSRQVGVGDLYLAVLGTQVDGHDFIPDALSRGAAAVVGSRPEDLYKDHSAPYLQVADTRQALAQLAAAWYDYPARKLVVLGVTGTDGKTTTVNLIYHILLASGLQAGLISTVNAVIGSKVLDTGFHVTTPEAWEVQHYLSEMVQAGLTHVVLEATSHGLAQKRVAACEFDIGVVTNITHEHLDYHGDYQSYLDAKAELFRLVAASGTKPYQYHKLGVLNRDDGSFAALKKVVDEAHLPWVDYGLDPRAAFSGGKLQAGTEGLRFEVLHQGVSRSVSTRLKGDYNLSNCLAAAAACVSGLGLSWDAVSRGIEALPGIPGRMESVQLGQDFLALVDFAHTPNALRRALAAGRKMTAGRVIAVFGSAGLRDREKRRLMAEVSGELAALTVLTAEDPRTESLDGILEEMAGGLRSLGKVEGKDFWRVADRGQAIRFALQLAEPGDLVMVCGKGHEQSMCFGEMEYPWDDRTALQAALAEMLGKAGPDMPYLPTRERH